MIFDKISLYLGNDINVTALVNAALMHVPQNGKNFYKFWWNQELKAAKAASVESNNLWKVAGKPRQGPIFEKRAEQAFVSSTSS